MTTAKLTLPRLDLEVMIPGQAGELRFTALGAVDGTWTWHGGSAGTVALPVAVDGDDLVVSWSGVEATAVIGAPWALRLDGHDRIAGDVRRAKPGGAGTGNEISVAIDNDGTTVTVSIATSIPGPPGPTGPAGPPGVVAIDLHLAAAAVDGTATSFEVLIPAPGADAAGVVPAGWASTFSVPDLGTFSFLLAMAGFAPGDTVTVLIPGGDHVGIWRFASDNVDIAWESVVALMAIKRTADEWHGFAATDRWITTYPVHASDVGYTGAGLLAGTLDLATAMDATEGSLDRNHYVSCVYTAPIDMAGLLDPDTPGNWPTPDLGTWHANSDVAVLAQSDPTEIGLYRLELDGTARKMTPIEAFDPAGNGAQIVINQPVPLLDETDQPVLDQWDQPVMASGPDEGITFEWHDNNLNVRRRVSTGWQPSTTGRWVRTGPAATATYPTAFEPAP